jgi:hypothetical protein
MYQRTLYGGNWAFALLGYFFAFTLHQIANSLFLRRHDRRSWINLPWNSGNGIAFIFLSICGVGSLCFAFVPRMIPNSRGAAAVLFPFLQFQIRTPTVDSNHRKSSASGLFASKPYYTMYIANTQNSRYLVPPPSFCLSPCHTL